MYVLIDKGHKREKQLEFNCSELTIQNNFAHTTNQNILNCHVNKKQSNNLIDLTI